VSEGGQQGRRWEGDDIVLDFFLCIGCIIGSNQSICDESNTSSKASDYKCDASYNVTKYFDKFQSLLNKTVVNVSLLEENRNKCMVSKCISNCMSKGAPI